MKTVALWLLLLGLIALLTLFNPGHYLSVDSRYYLSMAGWLVGLDGNQYGHRATGWEGDFPIGYPLLIGVVARLTGWSLLIASKLVNSLFLGLFMLCWHRRAGSTATRWMGSVWLLGGFLRMAAYTWSECAFLVLLLEWLWLFRQQTITWLPEAPLRTQWTQTVGLLLLTMALFLLRYVGAYLVVAYGLGAAVAYVRNGRTLLRQRLRYDATYLLLSAACMGSYFYLNSLYTWPLGVERFYDTGEPIRDKLAVLALAPLNEILLLRDYVPGQPTALVWLGLLLQSLLMVWLWRIVRPRRDTILPLTDTQRQLFTGWVWTSATYLTLVFGMRLVSPFSGPNARMMAVVTLPMLMGLAWWVSRWPNLTLRRQVARWWVVLLLASTLQLLPQADLVGKVKSTLLSRGK